MCRTREYDFANAEERVEWFDIFVALVQYLLSGESKVGYLNNQLGGTNPIHKNALAVSTGSGKRVRDGDDSVEIDAGSISELREKKPRME